MLGEFVVTSLARIGLEVQLVGHPSSLFYAGLQEGRFDFFGTGSLANAPDPDDLFYGEFRSGSLLNFSGFSDHQVDLLLDSGRKTSDSAQRAKIYTDAQRILLSEAPCTALYHARIAVLVKPRWTGARFAVSRYPIVERTVLPSSGRPRS